MSYEYNIYNRMNVLCYDIENILDQEASALTPTHQQQQHVVKKLFYYFNRSCIDGKFVKPYLIRIFLSKPEEKELQWGVNELFSHFNKLPKYQLHTNVQADYNYIDINNKQFAIRNQETIDKFNNFEEEAYNFEVNKGNILINAETITQIYELIESYGLEYTTNENETDIIIYPLTAKYQVHISLNGKINKQNAYEIAPHIQNFKPYPSLGKFNKFNHKSTPIPNDDNLALISKCNYCQKPMIYNWWSYQGTRCPYCDKLNTINI